MENNGLSWRSDTDKIVILHTPKCASTTIRSHIYTMKTDMNTFDRTDYKLLAVVRDPVKRFISGLNALHYAPQAVCYFEDNNYKKGTWKEKAMYTLNHVKQEMYYNIHIVPQTWFHDNKEGIPFGIDDYIKFEDFNAEILRTTGIENKHHINQQTIHEGGITGLLEDEEVIHEIKNAYLKDFECYKQHTGETLYE